MRHLGRLGVVLLLHLFLAALEFDAENPSLPLVRANAKPFRQLTVSPPPLSGHKKGTILAINANTFH